MTKNSPKGLWNMRNVLGVLAVLALLVLGLALTSPKPRTVTGVVQSAGGRHVGKLDGRWREVATVKLADGKTILAYAKSSEPVSAGDKVILSKHPTVLGDPTYEVVAKSKR